MGASPWPKEDEGGHGRGRVKGGEEERVRGLPRSGSLGRRAGGRKGEERAKNRSPPKKIEEQKFRRFRPVYILGGSSKRGGREVDTLGMVRSMGSKMVFWLESLPAIGCGSQKKKIRNHALEGTEQMAVDIGNQVFYIRKPKGPKGVR